MQGKANIFSFNGISMTEYLRQSQRYEKKYETKICSVIYLVPAVTGECHPWGKPYRSLFHI